MGVAREDEEEEVEVGCAELEDWVRVYMCERSIEGSRRVG